MLTINPISSAGRSVDQTGIAMQPSSQTAGAPSQTSRTPKIAPGSYDSGQMHLLRESTRDLGDILSKLMAFVQRLLSQLGSMSKGLEQAIGAPVGNTPDKGGEEEGPPRAGQPAYKTGTVSQPATTPAANSGYTAFAGDPLKNSDAFLNHMKQMLLRPTPTRKPGDPVYDLLNGNGKTEKGTQYKVDALPPTARELEQLTEMYGIEFGLTYVKDKGLVLSTGNENRVPIAGGKDDGIWVVHTHPRGTVASDLDLEVLDVRSKQDKSLAVRVAAGEQFGSLSTFSSNNREVENTPL